MSLRARLVGFAVCLYCIQAQSVVGLKAPQSRPGTYSDLYVQQALGDVRVSSNGRFFLYEWGQPYFGWAPDTRWMAPGAARRLQTFLFVVDLNQRNPSSEYLFYPNAACSYWLGEVSPDNKNVIVFELSHDERKTRAGVWSFEDRTVRWFGAAVDEGMIETAVAWTSNEEFLYPIHDKRTPLVKASIANYQTVPCAKCTFAQVSSFRKGVSEIAGAAAPPVHADSDEALKDAKLRAATADGSIAIFERDSAESLSLLYKQFDRPAKVVFNNKRRWSPGSGSR